MITLAGFSGCRAAPSFRRTLAEVAVLRSALGRVASCYKWSGRLSLVRSAVQVELLRRPHSCQSSACMHPLIDLTHNLARNLLVGFSLLPSCPPTSRTTFTSATRSCTRRCCKQWRSSTRVGTPTKFSSRFFGASRRTSSPSGASSSPF